MEKCLGEQLVEKRIVTEKKLQMALERQKLQGGRITQNLVALQFITEEELAAFFKTTPQPPQTVEETGLDISFIADLIMKHVLFMGEFTGTDVADRVKLPPSVVGKAIDKLRKDLLLEVKGPAQLGGLTYRFSLTDRGKNRSTELFEISRYAGPAPARLHEYREMVRVQTIKSVIVSEKSLNDAFSHLVVNEELLKRLGPAVSSGKTMFL